METALTPGSASRWIWIFAIWLSVGLFDATQTVFSMRAQGMHHAWLKLFVTLLFAWVPIALATPLILNLARRYPPTRLRSFKTWAVHLPTCCAICLGSSVWVAGFEQTLNPWANPGGAAPFLDQVTTKFWGDLVSYFILYSAILGIAYALDSRERLARQETETARLSEALSRAQFNALRRQIEPHFLFNSLNSIAGLVRESRNDSAVKMIAGLSDFLRRTMEDTNRQEVPLSEELDHLQKYLEIQKVRFSDRLTFDLQVPGELLQSQVPSLILQPMVENAIKHGISKRAQGGQIRIRALRSNGTLTLKVYNDGPSLSSGTEPTQPGIGMSNVRTRLESLYGESFEFSLRNEGSNGVEAVLSLPCKEK
ncbi:MAG TPA: histidine kinase [Terriglobales bacterium]|nr:histidine kinase [Terriglobales bacterium]